MIDRLGSWHDAIDATAKLAKIDGEPRLTYLERELSRTERLLASLGDVMAPAMSGLSVAVGDAIKAQLGFAPPPLLQQAGQQAAQDLSALIEMGGSQAGGKPYSTVVHCLCRIEP